MMLLPLMETYFRTNSIPRVEGLDSEKESELNLYKMQVFPTPASPTTIYLKRYSKLIIELNVKIRRFTLRFRIFTFIAFISTRFILELTKYADPFVTLFVFMLLFIWQTTFITFWSLWIIPIFTIFSLTLPIPSIRSKHDRTNFYFFFFGLIIYILMILLFLLRFDIVNKLSNHCKMLMDLN